MIRVGRFDAFDKWSMLCRYWQNPASVCDPGKDKFDRPRLPGWQAAALRGGANSCAAYIWAKFASLPTGSSASLPAGDTDNDAVNRELAKLMQEIGLDELRSRVGRLPLAITTAGFDAPFDEGLSPNVVARMRDVFRRGALDALSWTEDVGEVPSIEVLRAQAATFPKEAVRFKRTALCLFCARFFGRSDVIHVHDAGAGYVTLVDSDAAALAEMQLIYPAGWTFVPSDYKAFLDAGAQRGLSYDLVIADPFKDLGPATAWDCLPTIMRLCTDTFITNYFPEMFEELGVAPDDLEGLSRAVSDRTGVTVRFLATLERSNGVHWAVMRPR